MLNLPYLNVPELQLKAISEGGTVNRMKSAFHFHMYELHSLRASIPSGSFKKDQNHEEVLLQEH